MNSGLITLQASESLEMYFKHLSMTGYMSYGKVHKLLGLLLLDLFLNSEFRALISEEDYNVLGKFLYCISGNCLIPYQQFLNDPAQISTVLPKFSGESPFRLTESQRMRYTEYSDARVTEYRTKYWSKD